MNKDVETLFNLYHYQIYGESPLIVAPRKNWVANMFTNNKITEELIVKYPFIQNVECYGTVLKLYRSTSDINNVQDYFVDEHYTVVTFAYEKYKGGILFLYAWNLVQSKGFARWLVFDYYLNEYMFIASDDMHTPEGKIYWEKLIEEALQKRYKVTVVSGNDMDVIATITKTTEIEQYYSTAHNNPASNLKFKISKT